MMKVDEMTTSGPASARPGRWLFETLRIRPAQVPVGHSVRSAVAVGTPFIVGALTDHIVTGMWIGLATLLLAAGEREGTYRLNFQIIAVSTPIAASGYVLGYLSGAPLPALIVLMALLAALMGLIAGLGPAFSVGGMQFLLIAAIALGAEHIDWLLAIGMYLVGAVGYAALLAVEMVLVPARPQRGALAALLTALAGLAQARAADLVDGGNRVAAARSQAATAQTTAVGRVGEFGWARRRVGTGPHGWTLDDEVVAATDDLAAIILGARDGAELAYTADRLDALAERVAGQPSATTTAEAPGAADSPLDHRLDRLVNAVCTHPGPGKAAASPFSTAIGSEAVFAATRLAFAFAVAVGAKAYFPFNHWFWVPLTVCLVMKPDFGSVFSRAILRVLGTIVGAAVATAVILAVPKGLGYGIAIAVLAATVPWLMMRSYALQAVAITPIVIVLVDVISPGKGGDYGWQRIAATAIGGVIVVIFGYLIWPHSRRHWVQQSFATMMDAIADQLQASATAGPGRPDVGPPPAAVMSRRTAAHLLFELHQRLHRALAEPPPAETVAQTWLPVVAAADQLAAAVTVYTDDLAAGRTGIEHSQISALCAAIRDLGHLLRTPTSLPAAPEPALTPVTAAVGTITDLLTTQIHEPSTPAPAL